MSFVHRHSNSDFWFTASSPLGDVDRKELESQSPGFSSVAKVIKEQLAQGRKKISTKSGNRKLRRGRFRKG